MNLDHIFATFIAESRDLLVSMEESIMRLEKVPEDAEAIAATFRAAHTIKGSAGLFNLDDIVGFTHVLETVLDRVRNAEVVFDGALAALVLECSDHVGDLVSRATGDLAAEKDQIDSRGRALLDRLFPYCEAQPKGGEAITGKEAGEAKRAAPSGNAYVGNGSWHLSLRLDRDVLRRGMDPTALFRHLSSLGKVVSVTTLGDAIPAAAEMDPEACYLGFEISFYSVASREAIEEVFEFVRDDSQIFILAPHCRLSEYRQLIWALPEGPERMGQILLATGALSRAELESVLYADQSESPPVTNDPVQAAPQCAAVAAAPKDAGSMPVKDRRSTDGKYLRVDAAKLDDLINEVGEMVIASAAATLLARRTADSGLHEAMTVLVRMVEQIRDSALGLRMVEIGETFRRFQRVVRDVSHELGKDITLEISGEATELDKTVIEKISDPLMHLVRNAMDHGIEAPETRLGRGKPAAGLIKLDAYHESGSIVIEVSDDGAGLNREKILNKAIERGIIEPGKALSEADAFALIFEPGFSTADRVTNLSGRGVGMDVVRRNIQALRGTIDVQSQEGAGSLFRIRLPLTLAIIDGFLVEVADRSFVVPLEMLVECLQMPEADRQAAAGRQYLNLRGEVLPFARLRDVLGIEGKPARRENIVVVEFGGRKVGLVVDRLLGEFQTVIKPLGSVFEKLRGFSGSTILGSGQVALILDVPAIVQRAASPEGQKAAA